MDVSLSGVYFLRAGATLSFIAAAFHVAIIVGGASWYRFFGAGEQMALASEAGELFPHILTLAIAAILTLWGLYALSGAGDVTRLPLLKTALVLITAVYLIRGFIFVPVFWNTGLYSISFMLWSSAICSVFGVVHLVGLSKLWSTL